MTWMIIRKLPQVKNFYIGKTLGQGVEIICYVNLILGFIEGCHVVFTYLLIWNKLEGNEFIYQIILDIGPGVSTILFFKTCFLILDVIVTILLLKAVKKDAVLWVLLWLKIILVVFFVTTSLFIFRVMAFLFIIAILSDMNSVDLFPFYKLILFGMISEIWNFYAIVVIKSYWFEKTEGTQLVTVSSQNPTTPPQPGRTTPLT